MLTAEQREQIERRRQAALQRLAERRQAGAPPGRTVLSNIPPHMCQSKRAGTPGCKSPRSTIIGTPPEEASKYDDECSICYASTVREMRAEGQQGRLDCCGHAFCFECIKKWASEVTNSCPLCKRSVSRLERVGRGGAVLETLAIAAREVKPPEPTEAELQAMQEEAEAEDNCVVCGSGEQDDVLLLCDSCNSAYHTFCLVPRLRAVPEGDWFCPDCQAARPTQPDAAEEARVGEARVGEARVGEARVGARRRGPFARQPEQPEVIVLEEEEEEGEAEGGVIRRVVRLRHNAEEGGALEFEARPPPARAHSPIRPLT